MHLSRVLTKLREKKLYFNASKCQFAVTEIEFRGRKVTRKGMCSTEESYEPSESGSAPVTLGMSDRSWALQISIDGTLINMLKLQPL